VDKLTLYDYLGFILPGGIVIASVAYGFELATIRAAPSAEGLILLTAAAFVVGHLNAAVANLLQPLAWGQRPGARLSSTLGVFGKSGTYSEEAQQRIEEDFASLYPQGVDFQQRFNLGYTRLRQEGLDTGAQIMNQQIGFYRNMAASTLTAMVIVGVATLQGHDALKWWLWLPLGAVAVLLEVFRFRRFWGRFGNEVIRGVQAKRNTWQ
jgi:hypothetical protein